MAAGDVEETLQMALDKADVTQVKVRHRPRLLSYKGPAFVPRLSRIISSDTESNIFGVPLIIR
jgi:hypothetical protein